MALHVKGEEHVRSASPRHAAEAALRALPKHRFPDRASPADVAASLVHDELLLDGRPRQNLATFCTTWISPEVRTLMGECLDKNLIDRDEYPQTAEIESRCVLMLADLWQAPDPAATVGCSTTGSSEAALLSGLALKWRWRQRRIAAGRSIDRPNLVCGPAHVCWRKFAKYFDVELRELPMRRDALGMQADQVVARCDENTIGVVAALGVTFTGAYEPVAEIAAVLDDLQRRRGLDIPIHVDAATGGFVAPFAQPEIAWDFRLARVTSINASGHKYGLSPLGVGWVVWRDTEDLPPDLIFDVDSLGGPMPTFALNFSRPGGQIIAQYYNFIRYGRVGYTQIQQSCLDTAQYLAGEIGRMGPFEVLYAGVGGLPGVTYTLRERPASMFSLYDLADRIRMRGWQIATYPLPPNRQETVVQRILVRHGVTRDLLSLLVDIMGRALEFFRAEPVPVTGLHRPSFHH